MEHSQAQTTKAAERYLLGEMSEPERFEFEEHYFGCDECAGDVRALHALAHGIKVLGREGPAALEAGPRRRWFQWHSSPMLVLATAGLGLAVLSGYQSFVVIPSLRWQAASRAMAPIVLRAAARGEEQALEIRKDAPVSLFSLDVNNAEPGTPLTYQVVGPGRETRVSGSTTAPPAGSPLIVSVANAEFRQPGAWMLVLRAKPNAAAHYPFNVQLK
jgi:putative zinc finger protein